MTRKTPLKRKNSGNRIIFGLIKEIMIIITNFICKFVVMNFRDRNHVTYIKIFLSFFFFFFGLENRSGSKVFLPFLNFLNFHLHLVHSSSSLYSFFQSLSRVPFFSLSSFINILPYSLFCIPDLFFLLFLIIML